MAYAGTILMQAGLTETCTYGAWPSAEDARGLLFFRYCDVIILAEMHTFVPLPALPYPWLQVHSADPGYCTFFGRHFIFKNSPPGVDGPFSA